MQAFRKKAPSQDQGSFNFAKSNHFKHLQDQHPRKINPHKKCDAKCDASVMQFRKYSHHFSPNIRLWLRKNTFYYMVELPRVDGKRRYKRISLHTNNYYEARERVKQMSITFEPEIANQMRMKLALNPFPTQEKANQMRNEAIRKYNTKYMVNHTFLIQNINCLIFLSHNIA